MSDQDQWIPQAGRIYVEAKGSIERATAQGQTTFVPGAYEYARQFNTVLGVMKNIHSDFVIDSMSMITFETSSGGTRHRTTVMSEVVLKSGRLIDHLGYTIPEDQLSNSNSDAPIIQMEQTNQQEQTANQSTTITVESTIEQISHLRKTPAEKEDLEKIVSEFEDEISKDDTDQSRIKQLIQTANEKSPDVAANLLMLALQHGIIQASQFLSNL